jgi:8-amino-7-oxononanoate synthase
LVATIRASYALLQSEQGQAARERVQHVVRFFYEELTSHPAWHTARERGLLSVPLADDWDSRAFQSHISTVWTRPQYMYWLYFHLHAEGYCVWPIEHPVVPIGQSRIKVSFHAANTDEQVQGLVDAIFDWVEEVTAIEEGRANAKVTHAASVVYEWMRSEGLDGFGMV